MCSKIPEVAVTEERRRKVANQCLYSKERSCIEIPLRRYPYVTIVLISATFRETTTEKSGRRNSEHSPRLQTEERRCLSGDGRGYGLASPTRPIYRENYVDQTTDNVGSWPLQKSNPPCSRMKFEGAENIDPFSSKIDRVRGKSARDSRASRSLYQGCKIISASNMQRVVERVTEM